MGSIRLSARFCYLSLLASAAHVQVLLLIIFSPLHHLLSHLISYLIFSEPYSDVF